MADIIQIRRDTQANWASADPILASGEFGHETDTLRTKIGDGTTVYSALPYAEAAVNWGNIAGVLSDQADLQAELNLKANKDIIINDQIGLTYTLVSDDNGKYIRMSNTLLNTITVPLDSSVPYSIGTQIHIRQVDVGQTVIASTAVINTSETLKLNKQGSTVTLLKVDVDEWDLFGDLETV